ALARVTEAIVQPVGAVLPELPLLGDEAVAAPVLRPGRVFAVPGTQLLDCGLQLGASRDRLALPRGGCREAAARSARREILVRLLPRDPLDRPLDPHLPAELVPVEDERRARIG